MTPEVQEQFSQLLFSVMAFYFLCGTLYGALLTLFFREDLIRLFNFVKTFFKKLKDHKAN